MENVKRKGKLFQISLFWEAMRQLRVIGVLGAVIMAVSSILIPIAHHVDNVRYSTVYERVTNYVARYTLLRLNPALLVIYFVMVPLMTLYLFNYLNRRNASDFYHSIPAKRETVFISFGAAILAWVLFVLVEGTLISIVSALCLSTVELSFAESLPLICNIIAGSIYMYGIIMVAIGVTGTNFSNLAVAGMILLVPRIFTLVYMATLQEKLPILPYDGFWISHNLNVVTGFIDEIVFGNRLNLYAWSSFLYTLVVGLIYTAIALWLFMKRKSEVAAQAALNSKVQLVIRLIPSIMISLVALVIMFNIYTGSRWDATEVLQIVTTYIVAVLAYFIYEIVTTKKIRTIYKTIPGLIGLIVFDVIVYVALTSGYKSVMNNVPKASEVSEVRILLDGYGQYQDPYLLNKISKIEMNSPELIELVLGELERNIDAIQNDYTLVNYDSEIRCIEVTFGKGINAMKRRVYLTPSSSRKLLDLVADDSDVNKVITKIIDEKDIAFTSLGLRTLNPEQCYDLYQDYMKELASLPSREAVNLVLDQYFGWYRDGKEKVELANISLELKDGGYVTLPLTAQTPDTMNTLIRITNATGSEPLKEFFEANNNIKERMEQYRYLNAWVTFTIVDDSGLSEVAININMDLYGAKEHDSKLSDVEIKMLTQIKQELDAKCEEQPRADRYIQVRYGFGGDTFDNGYVADSCERYYVYDEEIASHIRELKELHQR